MECSLNLAPTEIETSFEEIVRARGWPTNAQQPAKQQWISIHTYGENFGNIIKNKEDCKS